LRELTGGIYLVKKEKTVAKRRMTLVHTQDRSAALSKKGFELAMTRTKKLCCVDKANVLETSRLWRETVQAMEKISRSRSKLNLLMP
jgi:3-isopropylmalate dehydrogenase